MDFREYLTNQGLSRTTIQNHLNNETTYDLQKMKIKDLRELASLSKQLSVANTLSKFYQYSLKENDWIVKFIVEINNQRRPKKLTTTLTIHDIKQKMNQYYKDKQWREFLVSYLLMYYQTRNQDLVATCISKGDVMDSTKNYLVLYKRYVRFIRNDYKTHEQYGKKNFVIRSRKVMRAVKEMLGKSISDTSNITRDVKNIIGITEGEFLKLYLKENNTSETFKRVSLNRGTNVETLLSSYADT